MNRKILSFIAALFLSFGFLHAGQQEQPEKGKPKGAETAAKSEEPRKPRRKRVVADLSGFDLLDRGKLKKKTMVVGATRGMKPPVALSPRLGKVYDTNPVLAWHYEGKAKDFVFILWNDAQEEVFRAEVTGTSYEYPPDAPLLIPGKTYFWTVKVSSPIFGSNDSSPAGFLLVSPRHREEIKGRLAQIAAHDPYQAELARARVFTDYRLWYDAVSAYDDLIARFPKRAELYEQRGMIYAQLEATQSLAEEDFARADELHYGRNSQE